MPWKQLTDCRYQSGPSGAVDPTFWLWWALNAKVRNVMTHIDRVGNGDIAPRDDAPCWCCCCLVSLPFTLVVGSLLDLAEGTCVSVWGGRWMALCDTRAVTAPPPSLNELQFPTRLPCGRCSSLCVCPSPFPLSGGFRHRQTPNVNHVSLQVLKRGCGRADVEESMWDLIAGRASNRHARADVDDYRIPPAKLDEVCRPTWASCAQQPTTDVAR